MLRYFPEYEPPVEVIWDQAYETAKIKAEQIKAVEVQGRAVLVDILASRQKITSAQIARMTGMDVNEVGAMLRDLRQRGLVERQPAPGMRGSYWLWVG